MKDVKSFFRVLGLILFVLFLSPISVQAEEPSDRFKQILNEEGKLVVTDTSHNTDMLTFLWDFLRKYGTDEYFFSANSFDKETSTACISVENPSEYHCVEVIFEEDFSENFNKILTNGKLIIPNSTERVGAEDVSSAVFNLSNDEYSFNIDVSYDPVKMEHIPLLKSDLSEATIVMRQNDTRYEERHIVKIDFLDEPTEEFIDYVGEDMTLEFNSIVPTTEEEFYTLFDVLYYQDGVEAYYTYVNDDFSSCDLKVNGETHTVDVIYNYDENVKNKLQNLINNLPEDLSDFKVRDLEIVNYWLYTFNKDDVNALAGFSGDLKKYMNNYNVKLIVNSHAGNDAPFVTARLGMAAITHNGIAYYSNSHLGAVAEHIIYVPDSTSNTREALIAAAQKRINDYLGNNKIATITYGGTAKSVWEEVAYELTRYMWEEEDPNMTFEQWKMGFSPAYEDFGNEVIEIDGIKENDDAFYLTFKIDGKEKKYPFFIKRDSSKMVVPTYKTADTKTDISISSTNYDIPLDTMISANRLTSGKEYEKIIKLLDVKDNLTYDLKLFSNSLEQYITKLEDGTFEVRIPLTKELKGKDLVAYYVNEKGKAEPYKVELTKDKNYAVFKTNHFSIYTLAEGQFTNPQTGDNFTNYVITGIISLIGFVGLCLIMKKNNFLRTN